MERVQRLFVWLLVATALWVAPSRSRAGGLTEVLYRAWMSGRAAPELLVKLPKPRLVNPGMGAACEVCLDPVGDLWSSIDEAAQQAVVTSERAFARDRHAVRRNLDETSDYYLGQGFKVAPYEMRTSRWHVPANDLLLSRVALIFETGGVEADWVTGTILGSADDWKTFYLMEDQTSEIVRLPIRGKNAADVMLYEGTKPVE